MTEERTYTPESHPGFVVGARPFVVLSRYPLQQYSTDSTAVLFPSFGSSTSKIHTPSTFFFKSQHSPALQ